MLKPRNSFVICSIIERSAHQVGAIIVPAGGEAFAEALVVSVPDDNAHTRDLKAGQIVWVQHKRPGKNGQGQPILLDSFIPYRAGKHLYAMLEESQIMGIIADDMEIYAAMRKENREVEIQNQLLA